MATRQRNDGLSKRCDCPRRKWLKCEHPWHFDFYCRRTAHLYGGRAKHRYSLDVLAVAKGEQTPRTKGDAEALSDRVRSEIRLGTFRDPNQPQQVALDPHAAWTVGDVITKYEERHVPTRENGRPRRPAAQQTMRWHLGVLRRTEIPAAHSQTIRFELKPIKDVTTADIKAIRDARRRAAPEALAACEQWDREAASLKPGEKMDRPKPRLVPGCKSGEVGINRLLERVRHLFSWAVVEGFIDSTPFKRGGEVVIKMNAEAESPRDRRLQDTVSSGVCEEEALLQQAAPHLRALIVAGIATGCRLGELLGLQWQHVEYGTGPKGKTEARYLRVTDTKTYTDRRVPVSANLRAVLDMRASLLAAVLKHRTKELQPNCYVFGNEVGERIGTVRKAWETCILKAHGHKPQWVKDKKNQLTPESRAHLRAINLHFHDLRAEFGSRIVDSGSSLVEARDLLGHSDIKQTSTYLRSKSKTLNAAIERKEAYEREQQRERAAAREHDSHTDTECDNPQLPLMNALESPEVVKH